jgi:hypothetical protein
VQKSKIGRFYDKTGIKNLNILKKQAGADQPPACPKVREAT